MYNCYVLTSLSNYLVVGVENIIYVSIIVVQIK